jgi:hypothetical protein
MPAYLEWFKEFIRVETDKFILVLLVLVFLHRDPGGDLKMVLGALIMAIQNNRYASGRSAERHDATRKV